jgi:hypothetical protein
MPHSLPSSSTNSKAIAASVAVTGAHRKSSVRTRNGRLAAIRSPFVLPRLDIPNAGTPGRTPATHKVSARRTVRPRARRAATQPGQCDVARWLANARIGGQLPARRATWSSSFIRRSARMWCQRHVQRNDQRLVGTLAWLREPCNANSDCAARRQCTVSFIDSDGDGFRSGAGIRACGTPIPASCLRSRAESQRVATGGMRDRTRISPSRGRSDFDVPTACGDFDYKCEGTIRVVLPSSCNGPASAPSKSGSSQFCSEGPFSQDSPSGRDTGFVGSLLSVRSGTVFAPRTRM